MDKVLMPLLGGALIGVAASLLLLLDGRVAGVSGIVAGLLQPRPGEWGWRAAFAGGLVSGGVLLAIFQPWTLVPAPASLPVLGLAGLAVGFGTRMGGGCTSGHGVCGLARFERRSLVATVTFMLAAIVTVAVVRR
jgi:uncharacterized membrane protein YedE/YeeE